jgi:hypothetical protein
MQNSYVRFGDLRFPRPRKSSDELKTDFVSGYVPISRGYRKTCDQPVNESDTNESDR